MRRAPSALLIIGSFGVAVAMLSVATTAAIVLLSPQPPALRMTVRSVADALRADSPEYIRSAEARPPTGTRAMLLEPTLAAMIGKPPEAVRAVWLEGVRRLPLAGPPTSPGRPPPEARDRARADRPLATAKGARPAPVVIVQRPGGSFSVLAGIGSGAPVLDLLATLPMPAFVASVRLADGRWLTVRPHTPLLSGWRLNVLVAFSVCLMMLVPIAWVFARRLTRPFRALAESLGDASEDIPDDGPRELREAAAAISSMRTRLAAQASERTRMLTAIAHDLRTPLTGLRLRVEASPEPQRGRMISDIERMQGMIGEVLAFARDAATSSERIDIRRLLDDILTDLDGGAAPVSLGAIDDVHVVAPGPAFRRVIENLLRNAIDYAGGGRIDVRRVGEHVTVAVIDRGPGIAADDRERLMQPFERGDVSRNRQTGGSGLGLSIVREFAAQQRGGFTLTDAPGGGTCATLRLLAD